MLIKGSKMTKQEEEVLIALRIMSAETRSLMHFLIIRKAKLEAAAKPQLRLVIDNESTIEHPVLCKALKKL